MRLCDLHELQHGSARLPSRKETLSMTSAAPHHRSPRRACCRRSRVMHTGVLPLLLSAESSLLVALSPAPKQCIDCKICPRCSARKVDMEAKCGALSSAECSAVIAGYCTTGAVSGSWTWMQIVVHFRVLDAISWNALIDGYAVDGHAFSRTGKTH